MTTTTLPPANSKLASDEPVLTTMGIGTLITNLILGVILVTLHHWHVHFDPTVWFGAVNFVAVGALAHFTRGKVTPNETVAQLADGWFRNGASAGRNHALADIRTLAGPVADAAGMTDADLVEKVLARLHEVATTQGPPAADPTPAP